MVPLSRVLSVDGVAADEDRIRAPETQQEKAVQVRIHHGLVPSNCILSNFEEANKILRNGSLRKAIAWASFQPSG
jgi:hypothetical protein